MGHKSHSLTSTFPTQNSQLDPGDRFSSRFDLSYLDKKDRQALSHPLWENLLSKQLDSKNNTELIKR